MRKNQNPHAGKTPLAIVQEIHKKVLTNSDNAIAEAEKHLAEHQGDLKEFEELKLLAERGFGNSEEVVKNKELIEKSMLLTEKSRLIKEYQLNYPTFKFILADEMEAICKEYGLLMGADQHYIGTIPPKARKEIISFKLREKDYMYYEGRVNITKAGLKESEGVIEWTEIDRESYMRKTNNGKNLVQNGNRTHFICNNDYFLICAPQDMFKLEGKIVDGVKIKEVIKVDDPIALKAVRYGYLVAAVWGEEIAIKKMQNPTHN